MLPNLPWKFTYTRSKQLISGERINDYANMLTSFQGNITATPAGTALTSFPLNNAYNEVTVVAAANDGVLLPPAKVGLSVCVTNSDAADSLRVFAQGTDTIKGAASFDIAAAGCTWFVSNKDGTWRTFNAA